MSVVISLKWKLSEQSEQCFRATTVEHQISSGFILTCTNQYTYIYIMYIYIMYIYNVYIMYIYIMYIYIYNVYI